MLSRLFPLSVCLFGLCLSCFLLPDAFFLFISLFFFLCPSTSSLLCRWSSFWLFLSTGLSLSWSCQYTKAPEKKKPCADSLHFSCTCYDDCLLSSDVACRFRAAQMLCNSCWAQMLLVLQRSCCIACSSRLTSAGQTHQVKASIRQAS